MTSLPLPLPTPQAALKAYKGLVEGFEQAQPMMLWYSGGQIHPVSVVAPEEDMSLGEMYAQVGEKLVEQLGQPRWIVVSAESWVKEVASRAEAETYRHGDAERAPDRREAVVIVAVSTTEEWASRTIFQRTGSGAGSRVRWEESEIGEAAGMVADTLRILVR